MWNNNIHIHQKPTYKFHRKTPKKHVNLRQDKSMCLKGMPVKVPAKKKMSHLQNLRLSPQSQFCVIEDSDGMYPPLFIECRSIRIDTNLGTCVYDKSVQGLKGVSKFGICHELIDTMSDFFDVINLYKKHIVLLLLLRKHHPVGRQVDKRL